MAIKGVIFDMDGTLVDVPYDWQRIRTELETGGKPVLVHLQGLEEPERSAKWKKLEKFEREATRKASLKKGIPELLDYLKRSGIKKALVTNNSRKNVAVMLKKFSLHFDCIITRESGHWKPSGEPFMMVLKKFGLKKDECCVVGDSHFDLIAASDAGIGNVFILGKRREEFTSTRALICKSVPDVLRAIERLSRKPDKTGLPA